MLLKALPFCLLALLAATVARAAGPPDYKLWQELLSKYYDPVRGMSYRSLKEHDKATLDQLRQQLAAIDVAGLSKPDQLAYWINLYNVSTLAVVVDGYPTKIRAGFKDPRIHFAINCAAKSCPPIRTEPYVGARLNEQLDDQARRFLNGPHGARIEKDGSGVTLHVTKILDWFKDDFEKWGGGRVPFVRKYLTADKQQQLDAANGKVKLAFDDYDWALNDASR